MGERPDRARFHTARCLGATGTGQPRAIRRLPRRHGLVRSRQRRVSRLSSTLFVATSPGSLFGWDDAAKKRPIPGSTETTLSARLPGDLRGSAKTPVIGDFLQRAGAIPLYRTDDEWAAEISNDTVHGVLHLAWVEQRDGRYRAQMGVYVKVRGKLGAIYMMLIAPFRHLIVYPALMRQIGRAWDARDVATPSAARDPQRG